MTIEEVAKQILMYRRLYPTVYPVPARMESVVDQAWHVSKQTMDKPDRIEAAHIVMRALAGSGFRFTKDRKPYNPYSRTIMGDFPKKWCAEAPLLIG